MRLEAVQGDGAPLRTHLERLHQATGELDARLAASRRPLPPALRPLWQLFVRLSHSRQGEGGIAPSEIEAYGRLHRLRFTGWEVDTLLDIDLAWRAAGAQGNRQGNERT